MKVIEELVWRYFKLTYCVVSYVSSHTPSTLTPVLWLTIPTPVAAFSLAVVVVVF